MGKKCNGHFTVAEARMANKPRKVGATSPAAGEALGGPEMLSPPMSSGLRFWRGAGELGGGGGGNAGEGRVCSHLLVSLAHRANSQVSRDMPGTRSSEKATTPTPITSTIAAQLSLQ